jgi:hypothetical protein
MPLKVEAFHQWKSGPLPTSAPVMGVPTSAPIDKTANGNPEI